MIESSGATAPGSDAELLNAIRSGEPWRYDLLRARHGVAARRLAELLVAGPAAAEVLVARAFERVLAALERGGGPTDAFRLYLLTAVRRAAREQADGTRVPIDDRRIPDPGQLPADPASAESPAAPIVAAFLSLPERWRAVLWHTAVEGATPAEAAGLLGLPEAGAVELADQARDGLARAYRSRRQTSTGPGQRGPATTDDAAAGPATTDDATADDAAAGPTTTDDAAAGPATTDDATADDAAAAGAALRGGLAPIVLGEAAEAYLAGQPQPGQPASSPGTGRPPSAGAGSGSAASRLVGGLRESATRSPRSPRSARSPRPPGSPRSPRLPRTPRSPRSPGLHRQRAVAGAAVLLAALAIGGYALTLGSGAAGVTAGATSPRPARAGVTSRSGSASPGSGAPAASARPPAPAASRAGDNSARRRSAAGQAGASPTSARPLLVTPAWSPPPAAVSRSPSAHRTAETSAPGLAVFRRIAAVNVGAEAIRLFSLVLTGSMPCAQPVHGTIAATEPSASALPGGPVPCRWSAEPGATRSGHREPGSRGTAIATSPGAAASPGPGTNSPAVTRSGTRAGPGSWITAGWHRGTWPGPGAQWPTSPWPASPWPASPWPGRGWPGGGRRGR